MNTSSTPDPERTAADGHATIADVARKAGVSKATVSRFLNHRDTLLTPQIATRVEAAIEALGYSPRPMAQALKRGRSRLIGLVVADIANPFSVAVIRGAEKACQNAGYLVMLFNLGNALDREREAIKALASYQVDGFILNTIAATPIASEELARYGRPAVLIDRRHDEMQADFVSMDNVGAMRLALDHLVGNGYQELLYITRSTQGVSPRLERSAAFQHLLVQHAPGVQGRVAEIAEHNESELVDVLLSLRARAGQRPIAVVAGNAVVTLQVASAVRQLGWRFGTDIGFVGVDETEWAPLVGEGLTTIAQPTDDIGHMAAQCLLERIQGDTQPPRQLLLPGRLVTRPSSVRSPFPG
jgi:LacI family kdg operon repressor